MRGNRGGVYVAVPPQLAGIWLSSTEPVTVPEPQLMKQLICELGGVACVDIC